MLLPDAAATLSALAHAGRLGVLRLLIRTGPEGIAAGDIAREIGVRANTLSAQLAILEQAGLARSRRDGRSIRYSANFDRMQALLGFLVADCCNGRPEICTPLTELAQGCGKA